MPRGGRLEKEVEALSLNCQTMLSKRKPLSKYILFLVNICCHSSNSSTFFSVDRNIATERSSEMCNFLIFCMSRVFLYSALIGIQGHCPVESPLHLVPSRPFPRTI